MFSIDGIQNLLGYDLHRHGTYILVIDLLGYDLHRHGTYILVINLLGYDLHRRGTYILVINLLGYACTATPLHGGHHGATRRSY